jgi:hypothetical protein
MPDNETSKDSLGIDKGLVAMFLKMSPEERLQANDNAARTIQELRDAFKRQLQEMTGFGMATGKTIHKNNDNA